MSDRIILAGSDFHVLTLGETATLNDLEMELSRVPVEVLRQVTGFGFRVPRRFVQAAGDPVSKELRRVALRRAHEKSIYLICFDETSGELQLSRLLEAGVSSEGTDLLPAIRYADLLATLRAAGPTAFLRSTKSYHFLSPSLRHTNLFLRVGDAICSRKALDALAFWCCPLIASAQAVIVDTWSISSVPLQAMQYIGKKILLDCLPAHPTTDRESAKSVLVGMLEALDWEAPVLFLSSAVASGDAVHATKMLLAELGCADLHSRWAALYGFANSPDTAEVFCRLQEDYQSFASPSSCVWCDAGSHPVPVNARAYHVAVGEETQVPLPPLFFSDHRSFIENYGSAPGVLRAHRDDPSDGRHHAFYIDVLTLLQNNTFLTSLSEALNSCHQIPQAVAAPDHAPGRALASIAARHFGIPLLIHNDLRRNRLDSHAIKILDDAESILIVDDVLKTGSRLLDFTRALREGQYTPFKSVEYLIAVARPESDRQLAQIRTSLTTNNTHWQSSLRWVEKLLLPEWSSEHCPWCKEYDVLGRVGETLPRPPEWLTQRMSRLSELSRGLLDEPFLLPPGQVAYPLGKESSVGPAGLTPIGTLFSFAGGLQGLRTAQDDKKRLQPEFPLLRSIAPRIFQNYSETLLRQCILRLVKPSEWPARTRAEPLNLFKTTLKSDPCLAGEFLLAMSRRSFMPALDEKLVELWRGMFTLERRELELLLGLAAT